ncbi:hypothetical protein MKW92_040052 [Papaver armeniacum]|nr:hypothetical protein MKW92_040052 [Papaver armeniacum]
MPQHSLPTAFLSDRDRDSDDGLDVYGIDVYTKAAVVYLDCSTNISDYPPYYLSTLTYVKTSVNMSSYVILNPTASEIKDSCDTFITSWMMHYEDYDFVSDDNRTKHLRDAYGSYVDVHDRMMDGFDICWSEISSIYYAEEIGK